MDYATKCINFIMKNIISAFAVVASFFLISCKGNTPNNVVVIKAPTITADDNKKIIDREISTWEFAKNKNLPAMREILGDDYVGFFGKNTMSANDVVKLFQSSTVNSYHLSNIRVKPVTSDVAIIYYELNQDIADADGKKWTPDVAAATTYVKRKGNWYSVFYQETVINN